MNALVLGGTRFFGVHMVNELLAAGHTVTIATRGTHPDSFGNRVEHLTVERTDGESLRKQLSGKHFDVACDNLAYCSEDVRVLLDVLDADRYVVTSSGAVYNLRSGVRETEADFASQQAPFTWTRRDLRAYGQGKQAMECAVFQAYRIPSVAVRFPYVIGKDDYTRRLAFYVEHVAQEKPMFVDNAEAALSFIHSEDAGRFLAWLAEGTGTGAVNACNGGAIRISEILHYAERLTGKTAVLSPDGDPAPYNGTPDYALDTSLAESWGYHFPALSEYIYDLLAFYVSEGKNA